MSRPEHYFRDRYHTLKDNGLCVRCRKPLDRAGCYCTACQQKERDYRRKNREFYREHNLCPECGKNKLFGDEKMCLDCKMKQQEYRAKHPISEDRRISRNIRSRIKKKNVYAERKANGICTRCGKRKAINGRAKCQICLDYDALIHRQKTFDKQNEKERRIENRLCYFCGEPLTDEKGKCCKKCADAFKNKAQGKIHDNEWWRKDNRLVGYKIY